MSLRSRTYEKEILDSVDIDQAELNRNLFELHVINKFLGGYKASIRGLQQLLNNGNPVRTLLDIGFGGGDSILELSEYSNRNNISFFIHGVDYKWDCVLYAKNRLQGLTNKKLHYCDYRSLSAEFLNSIDVIHCSLFLHHLTNEEITELLCLAREHNCMVVINDLHRNWFAYHSIKLLTFLFSRSRLVKNDAPLSVKRGFRKSELIELLKNAGFKKFKVQWSWAFRYVVIAES